MALFGKPKPPQEEPKYVAPAPRVSEPAAPPPVQHRVEPRPAAEPEVKPAQAREVPHVIARMDNVKKGVSAIIGSSIVIKGELLGDEEIVIEGRVEGKIHIKNNLIVGQKGSVEADIVAHGVIINGRVHGNIVADRVEIVASGSLEGNIKAPKISIADGAHFKGSVDMGHAEKEAAVMPVARPMTPAPAVVPRPAAPLHPPNPNPSLKL